MKVFLAGGEAFQWLYLMKMAEIKNSLFSYYYWIKSSDSEKKLVSEIWESYPQELICDSGLFTLMFGAGKGGSYDLQFMKEYTRKYIKDVDSLKMKDLTIVESDVHKLLGMRAVYELRKYFEDSGRKVLYVWHREEGIEGLYKMAEKYDYIAISVPELRILCKAKFRYQDAVKDLERKIFDNVKRLPRIHLLGNTVMETMQTNISYSCDSTSWQAAGRYGRYIHFDSGKLTARQLSSDQYLKTKHILETQFPKQYGQLFEKFNGKGKSLQYMTAMFLSIQSYKLYQGHLDKKFKCKAVK